MVPIATLPSTSQTLISLSKNNFVVGGTWMLSSMLFTTYYTTSFLKHDGVEKQTTNDFVRRQKAVSIDDSKSSTKPNIINVLSKYYTRPQLLTLFRFSGSFLLGIFANPNFFDYPVRFMKSWNAMKDFIYPAIFLFFANYCNAIALDRLGISLTYTSKCGIPILTVLITMFVDGFEAIPSIATLCTLIPIAVGIAMASWNSPTFDSTGFLAAVLSTTSQAALNVSSKRALTITQLSGLQAQTTMAALAFCFAIVATSVEAIKKFVHTQKQNSNIDTSSPPIPLTFGAVAAYHMEYVLSFLFLSLVKPITYGTCDAIRRLGVIICGRRMFGGEKFSKINYSGIGLALFGALCYSIVSKI